MSFEEAESATLRRALAASEAQNKRQNETIQKLERKIVAAGDAHKFLEEALQDERKMRAEFLAQRNKIDAEVEEKSGTILQLENFRKMCEQEILDLQTQNLTLSDEKKKLAENFETFAETATAEIRDLQGKVNDLEISLAKKADLSAELFAAERRWVAACQRGSDFQEKLHFADSENFQIKLETSREIQGLKNAVADARSEKAALHTSEEIMKEEISRLENQRKTSFEKLANLEEFAARMQSERIEEKNFLAKKIGEHNGKSVQSVKFFNCLNFYFLDFPFPRRMPETRGPRVSNLQLNYFLFLNIFQAWQIPQLRASMAG